MRQQKGAKEKQGSERVRTVEWKGTSWEEETEKSYLVNVTHQIRRNVDLIVETLIER